MGFGTWAWGNQLLWGYQESMDNELQDCFNLALRNGINLFDTADSYGTGRLNGQSERLLGKFILEFEGKINTRTRNGFRNPRSKVLPVSFFSYSTALTLLPCIMPGRIKSPDDVVIASKFAAYPWRLTSGQFVSACKYSPDLFVSCTPPEFHSVQYRFSSKYLDLQTSTNALRITKQKLSVT